jgi:predicted transcriptional regulator
MTDQDQYRKQTLVLSDDTDKMLTVLANVDDRSKSATVRWLVAKEYERRNLPSLETEPAPTPEEA